MSDRPDIPPPPDASCAERRTGPGGLQGDSAAMRAFDTGNYTQAYKMAGSPALKGCSLVMLGDYERGLGLIGEAENSREIFCSALAHWGLDEPTRALALLRRVDDGRPLSEATRRLAGFIERGCIRVLMQGREHSDTPTYDVVSNLRASPLVDLKSVSYASASDITIEPFTTLDTVLSALPDGWTPDLYFNYYLEDYPPPIGIERAPFVTFCHTQDYDRHFSQCYHLLSLFDGAIALGAADHEDMVRFTKGHAFVFPLLFTVDSRSNPWPRGPIDKTLDIYISGKNFDNNDAKSRRVFDICRLADRYKVLLHEGYVSDKLYQTTLRRARLTLTYVNRWGLINGRAVEAIREGCCALYQEGGELGIFLGEEDGAVPYRPEDNVADVAERVLRDWDARFAAAAQRGADRVGKLFDYRRAAKRLAIALAASAALTTPGRFRGDARFRDIRHVSRSWHRITFAFDRSPRRAQAVQQATAAALRAMQTPPARDALGETCLYEYLLEKEQRRDALVHDSAGASNSGDPPLDRTITVYEGIAADRPKDLAARFNLGRLCYEAGQKPRALEVFWALLFAPDLTYDPDTTLFWREFHDAHFDYDLFMREIVAFRQTGDYAALDRIARAVRDSSLGYAMDILVEHDDVAGALELFHRFPTDDTTCFALVSTALGALASAGDVDAATHLASSFIERKPWMARELGRLLPDRFKSDARLKDCSTYAALLDRICAPPPRLELVQSYCGLNILRFGDQVCVAPQTWGAIGESDFIHGGLRPEMVYRSVEEALGAIGSRMEKIRAATNADPSRAPRPIVNKRWSRLLSLLDAKPFAARLAAWTLKRKALSARKAADVPDETLEPNDCITTALMGPEPILVAHEVHGFNILYFKANFYAVPQGDGEFAPMQPGTRNSQRYFVGTTLEDVSSQVSKHAQQPEGSRPGHDDRRS